MRKLVGKITGLGMLVGLLLPGIAAAAGAEASLLVMVADTRKLTGWEPGGPTCTMRATLFRSSYGRHHSR